MIYWLMGMAKGRGDEEGDMCMGYLEQDAGMGNGE
jgi:hypothetical protein